MKILVTGGAGFIGKYLVEKFLKEHEVRIYDNLSSSEQNITSLIGQGADFVKGDILDYKTLEKSSKGYDVIIHLAAKSDVVKSVSNPKETLDVNVNGTTNVLKACVENKIPKIIFASSSAVYGDCKDFPITEDTITNPISPYGSSKLEAEKKIKDIAKKNGINYIILRMFNVYGKGQNELYAGVITKFLKNISENKEIIIFGDGKQTRDFISINDVVKSFECALKSNQNETYNIASGKSISINELSKMILKHFDKKIKIKYKEEQKGDIKNSMTDITLAKNKLGFFAKNKLEDELQKF